MSALTLQSFVVKMLINRELGVRSKDTRREASAQLPELSSSSGVIGGACFCGPSTVPAQRTRGTRAGLHAYRQVSVAVAPAVLLNASGGMRVNRMCHKNTIDKIRQGGKKSICGSPDHVEDEHSQV